MAVYATILAEDSAGNMKEIRSTTPLAIRRDRPHFTARLVPSDLSSQGAIQPASYLTFVANAKVVIEVSRADASISGCRVRLSRSVATEDTVAQTAVSIGTDGQHVASFSAINGEQTENEARKEMTETLQRGCNSAARSTVFIFSLPQFLNLCRSLLLPNIRLASRCGPGGCSHVLQRPHLRDNAHHQSDDATTDAGAQ